MKIACHVLTYSAVPSMLTVAPTGMTKRVTRGSMPILSSVLIVTGIVAELNSNKIKMFKFNGFSDVCKCFRDEIS